MLHVTEPLFASGPSSNRVLNYQIRLTDANGVALVGTQNVKLSFYTAASGGTPVHTDCGTTGTPVARKIVLANGVGTVLVGDTAASGATNCADASQPNALPANLFNNTSLYLGITVGADAEMTPRKRIVAQGYALNADMLDDLDTSAVGGSVAFVPVTDSSGNLVLTQNLTVDGSTVFVDATNNRVGMGLGSPDSQLDIGSAYSAGIGADYFSLDVNPTVTAGANDQVVSLVRLRQRGGTGGFTNVRMPLLVSENSGGGQFKVQLFENGLRIGNYTGGTASVVAPAANLELDGFGSTSATYAMQVENLAGADVFSIRNDGRIGIGTFSPAAKLDVIGNVRLTGAPTSVLTGSIDPAASTTVTGVGTLFTAELVVGDRITVTGQTRTVTAIASDTSLTVDTAFSDNANDTSPDALYAIATMRNSANALQLVVNDQGNVGVGVTAPATKLVVGGQTRVGESAATFNDFGIPYQLVVNGERTDTSGTVYGIYDRLALAPASASTAQLIGAGVAVELNGANSTGSSTGLNASVFKLGSGAATAMRSVNAFTYNNAGNVTDMHAIRSLNQTLAGTITNAYGLEYTLFQSGGTTTNAYGVKVASPSMSGGGAVTNLYGIHIDPQTVGGTSNFALLYNHGSSPFAVTGAGSVGVGTSNPASFKLQIDGGVGPHADDTHDLGSNALRWRDLYLGPASLHIGTAVGDEGLLTYNTSTNALSIDSTGAVEINGGSGSTGCSVDAAGNFSCSGSVSGGSGTAFQNGGNSFGAAAILGTNDANSLSFETNGATYLTIASGGGFTLPFDTNWTLTGGVNGLSFDGSTFSVDAANNRVGIGTAAPLAPLYIYNPASSGSTLYVRPEYTFSGGFQTSKGVNLYVGLLGSGGNTSTAFALDNVTQNENTGSIQGVVGGSFSIENLQGGTIVDAVPMRAFVLNDVGIITNAYGAQVEFSNLGTVTNTYGIHIGDLSSGTQTNAPYAIYSSDATARSYFAGNVGIGTTNPSSLLALGGNAARTFQMERHTTSDTAGNNLTVLAGGAASGAADKNGGNLVLGSGIATGTGASSIVFQVSSPGTSGIADNALVSVAQFSGLGSNNYVLRPATDGSTSVNFTYTALYGGMSSGDPNANLVQIVDTDKPTLFRRVQTDGGLQVSQCNGGTSLDECTTVTSSTTLVSATVYDFDVLERNNLAWFAYTKGTDVILVQCTNGSCTSTAATITIATGGNTKAQVTIARSPNNDHVGISWTENTGGTNYDVKYRRCEDPGSNCTTLSATQTLASFTNAEANSQLELAIEDNAGTDHPLAVFRDLVGDDDHLTSLACTTPTCTSVTSTTLGIAFGDGASSDEFVVVRDSDGKAAIAIAHVANGGVFDPWQTHVYKCTTLTCSSRTDLLFTSNGPDNVTVGAIQRSSGFLDIWYASSVSNVAVIRRCTSVSCGTYTEYNVYNGSYEPGNRGSGSRIAGLAERPNGDVRVFGHFPPDNFGALDVSSGNPSTVGVALGTGSYRFTNLALVGDATLRNATASGTIKALVGVAAGGSSSLNALDVHGGAVIGSTNAGTAQAPTNGLLVEGNVGIGDASPAALLTVGDGDRFKVNSTGLVTISPAAGSSGTPTLFTVTGPAHTGLAASTEIPDVLVNLGRTVTYAAGAKTLQRAFRIEPPTYAIAGGADSVTIASTVAIEGGPVAGAGTTIPNSVGLTVGDMDAVLSGSGNGSNATTDGIGILVVAPGVSNGVGSVTRRSGMTIFMSTPVGDQTATLDNYYGLYVDDAGGLTSNTNVRTINLAAGIRAEAPTAGSNVTIADSYALYAEGRGYFSGDVGVGTASPLARLDLAGNLRTTGKATAVLTGSIDPAASTTVTGVGTQFTTQLVVGDRITVTGQTRTVTAIASDTSLTVDTAFSDNANDTSPDVLYAIATMRDSANAVKLVVNDQGNVGIGEVAPSFNLDVNGSWGARVVGPSIYGLQLKSTDGTSDFSGIRWRDNANASLWSMGNDWSGNGADNFWLYDNATFRTPFFADGTNGLVGIYTDNTPAATLDVKPVNRSGASGLTRGWFQVRSGTYTDNATAASGTAASYAFAGIQQPTLAATNASVTTTDAATLYVANAPAAGTNMTITNPYALWVDAGNARFDGNVGIGTATPSNPLDVIKNQDLNTTVGVTNTTDGTSASLEYRLDGAGGRGASFRMYAPTYTPFPEFSGNTVIEANSVATDHDLILDAVDATGDIKFYTAGRASTNHRMIVTSSGNVGIGDTSPTSLLTVGASDAFQVNSSGRVLANVGASGAGNLAFSFVGDTDTGIYRSATDEIRVQTAGADRVTVDASGRVGIGDTTPSEEFTLQNDARINGHVILGNRWTAGDLGETVLADRVLGVSEEFSTNDLRYGVRSFIVANPTASTQSIIAGSFIATNNLTNATSTTSMAAIEPIASLRGIANATDLVGVNAFVAIEGSGTATEAYAVHTRPLIAGTGNIATYYGVAINEPTVTSSGTIGTIYGLAIDNFTSGMATGSEYPIYYFGTKRFVLTHDTKLGIGTDSPAARLHLEENTNSNVAIESLTLRRSRADSTAPGAADFGSDLTYRLEGFTDGGSVVASRIRGAWEAAQTDDTTSRDSYLSFATMANDSLGERLRIDSVGNIGIGTSSPTEALHVARSGATPVIVAAGHESAVNGPAFRFRKSRGTESSPLDVVSGDNTGAWNAQAYSGGTYFDTASINFKTDGTFTSGQRPPSRIELYTNAANGVQSERVRIDSSGNVGIGTVNLGSPSANLHVHDLIGFNTVDEVLRLDGEASGFFGGAGLGSRVAWYLEDSANNLEDAAAIDAVWEVATNGSEESSLRFLTSDNGTLGEKMRIDDNGNVGIGTSSPASPLVIYSSDPSLSTGFVNGLAVSKYRTAGPVGGVSQTYGVNVYAEDSATHDPSDTVSLYGGYFNAAGNATGSSQSAYGLAGYASGAKDASFGVYAQANAGVANASYYGLYGVTNVAHATASTAGGVTTISGVNFSSYAGTTTGVRYYGLYLQSGQNWTGDNYGAYINNSNNNTTVDGSTKYGLFLNSSGSFTGGAGAATTNYGLYVASATGADNNYAAVFQGGNVGIGLLTPAANLEVRSSSSAIRASYDADTYLDVDPYVGSNGVSIVFADAGSNQANLYYNIANDVLLVNSTGNSATAINTNAGNVGVGDISPDFKFDVDASGATVAGFNRTTSDGTIISLMQDGVEEGTISVSGTTVSYNAFTGSHYAWIDSPPEKGMLMTLTGDNRRLHGRTEGEMLYGVALAAEENDAKVLGAYLALQEPSKPADDSNPHLVMAVGNGELWVVDGGQDIAIGDYLIASSTPGHAVKDPATADISHVVARAVEPVEWASVADLTPDGKKRKLVSVTFESFSSRNVHPGFFGAKLSELTVDAAFDMRGYGIWGVSSLRGLGDIWSIDETGKLAAKEVVADQVAIRQTDTRTTLDTASVPSGQDYAQVHNSAVSASTRVFVTFRKNPGSAWWVEEVIDGLFVVKTALPVTEDVAFDYWLVQTVDERTMQGAVALPEPAPALEPAPDQEPASEPAPEPEPVPEHQPEPQPEPEPEPEPAP